MAILPVQPMGWAYKKRDSTSPNATHYPAVIAITTPFVVIMILVYLLRIYTRIRPVFRLHWDDYVITLAFVGKSSLFKERRITCHSCVP
jgi:hypothetical protein